ncbi:MAG: Holliday junction resolvase RusA-like endonuclease [Enterobacterales bacterium]|jgi:Holliday junction resolvase RusA-like endonuclease
MNLEVTIRDLKPVGLNNSYTLVSRGRFVSRVKKKHTREFEAQFAKQLLKYKREIKVFNDAYTYLNHCLILNIRFYIPVLKKNNTINKRSGDVDGLIKITQDCLFEVLDADDSEVIEVVACKIHSPDYKIVITLNTQCVKTIL